MVGLEIRAGVHVDRTVAVAEARVGSDRFRDESFRCGDGMDDIVPARETRRDRGRQHAARSMRVPSFCSFGGKCLRAAFGPQHIDRVTVEMSAFDEYVLGT